jgi:succinyl-CoA synthetase alpha subunit
MNVAREITAMEGVLDAAVVMGTEENKRILADSGLLTAELAEAGGSDLTVGVNVESESAVESVLDALERLLAQSRGKTVSGRRQSPASLEGALGVLPQANLVLISVAGRYAGAIAMDALEKGLNVMLFSDNVPLDTEVELKRYARKRNLLVMGPDCGTAIIDGVPLGFANSVKRGEIGIVAAAGTGLQEVSTVISRHSAGISQALGTGGRDIREEVGGITSVDAVKRLAADRGTRVILIVSKPPDPGVRERILAEAESADKPVVSLFLGAPAAEGQPRTLEEAACAAVALARGECVSEALNRLAERDAGILEEAAAMTDQLESDRRFLRGLFSGGTLCSEAQVILDGLVSNVYSNVPTA